MAEASTLSMDSFRRGLMRGDVALAALVLGVLAILLTPIPALGMDMLLAISIITSVLVLVTALLVQRPLEFTSFPAVLLLTTLFRLSLNVASTRLILTHGHNGDDSAGQVIKAFGDFVMGGNFIIGVIVFIILVIVNFVVITKGSTRIAEVAARFTLDSMPGKQMAIDADLSSGLINEAEARKRRKDLEDESNFFGAMDGASKFVRGDAIAGLMITAINVIGGIVIGTVSHGMPLAEAGDVYTRLTIGDGLVAQIPALIISVAAGLLVSKAGVEGQASKALAKQLASYPQTLGIVAFCAFAIGALPGMPHCTPETCNPGQRCLHTSHAEENALGFCDGQVATAYVTHEPCLTCARSLVRRGVRRVVYEHAYLSIGDQERAERQAILDHFGVGWELLARRMVG